MLELWHLKIQSALGLLLEIAAKDEQKKRRRQIYSRWIFSTQRLVYSEKGHIVGVSMEFFKNFFQLPGFMEVSERLNKSKRQELERWNALANVYNIYM